MGLSGELTKRLQETWNILKSAWSCVILGESAPFSRLWGSKLKGCE